MHTKAIDQGQVISAICQEIEHRIGAQRWKVWFKNATRFNLVDDHLRIGVPNQFIGSWIENHFIQEIRQAAEQVCNQSVKPCFAIDPKLFGCQPQSQLNTQAKSVEKAIEKPPKNRKKTPSHYNYILQYVLLLFLILL